MKDHDRSLPVQDEVEKHASSAPSAEPPDKPGKLAEYTGTGKHASTAIAMLTIKWSFLTGGALSMAFMVYACLTKGGIPSEEIKTVWTGFLPLMTLALGYLFHKGKE